MGKLLVLVVAGILSALAWQWISLVVFFPHEREQVEPPNCRLIEGMEAGSEDLEILPNGFVFYSTGIRFPGFISLAPDKHGEIMFQDLNKDNSKPVALPISGGFDMESLNPHGISLYQDKKDGVVYLFVINHPHPDTTVEIFKFQPDDNSLLHLRTIKHDLLYGANDLVAVGPESFYISNWYYFHNKIGRAAELYLSLPLTNVVYYSPTELKEVASGLRGANGLAVSPDKKYIYLAENQGQALHVFERHDDRTLTPVKVLPVETFVDNLNVDPTTGDIWIGCIPDLLKIMVYDPKNPPGSEVVRVQNILSENPIVTRVYVNNGSVLQGSSVASVYKKKLIVGTVLHKALQCDLN